MNKHEKWMLQWLTQPEKDQNGWRWGMMAGRLMVYPKEKRVKLLKLYASAIIDGKPDVERARMGLAEIVKDIKSLGWMVDDEDVLDSDPIIEPKTHSIHLDTVHNKITFVKGTEDGTVD